MTMYRTIVWATDGSGGADAALEEALRLVAHGGERIVAVHGDHRFSGRPSYSALPEVSELRAELLRRAADLGASHVHVDVVVRRGRHAAADLVAEVAADLGADVIVCGTRGLGAITGTLLGSFTQRLLRVAPCPVLAVPLVAVKRPAHEEWPLEASA
jgi:nucleotide-binding universal stress UspA family protein